MEVLKLLVLGDFAAGKTTFIQAISEVKGVSTDIEVKDHHPFVMDFGSITPVAERLALYLFGGSPYKKLLEFWQQPRYRENIIGCLYLVRSNDEAQLQHSAGVLAEILTLTPYSGVVANFQDQAQALPPHQLRQILNIPAHIPVLPCIATDEAHVRRVLIEFFKSLPQDENIRLVLDKITTQAALDLDLSQYDQKPDVRLEE